MWAAGSPTQAREAGSRSPTTPTGTPETEEHRHRHTRRHTEVVLTQKRPPPVSEIPSSPQSNPLVCPNLTLQATTYTLEQTPNTDN